jgi:hypothetical protein
MSVVVNSDGALYVSDSNSKLIRKLTNTATGWQVTTVSSGAGLVDCNSSPMVVTNPMNLGIGSAGELYTFDYNCYQLKSVGLPPPLAVLPFFNALACPGVAHRLKAAAGPGAVVDSVAGGGWSATGVEAGPGAPLSTYLVPMVRTATAVAASADIYNSAQQAWVFRGSSGMNLAPGSGASIGGPAGLSIAAWFRLDDNNFRATQRHNVVFQLTLAGPSANPMTLTLSTKYAGTSPAIIFSGERHDAIFSSDDADYGAPPPLQPRPACARAARRRADG